MSTPSFSFAVHGIPKGQPRPRAYAMRMGANYTARMYADRSAEGWTNAVAAAIAASRRHAGAGPLFTSPVAVTMVFTFPRPKSHFTGKGVLRAPAPHYCTTKPDADNLAKLVLDVITRAGWIWKDDATVASLSIVKTYDNTAPGVGVAIEVLPR